MNKATLQARLDQARVLAEAYSLDGDLPNERYVLSQEGSGSWEVYYSERGLKTNRHSFDSESAACEFLLDQILNDPSTRQRSELG